MMSLASLKPQEEHLPYSTAADNGSCHGPTLYGNASTAPTEPPKVSAQGNAYPHLIDETEIHDGEHVTAPAAVHAHDVLGDRRKRRKVSLESTEQIGSGVKSVLDLNHNVEPGNSTASVETEEQPVGPDHDVSVKDFDLSSRATPGTPKRRRGRPPKSANTPVRQSPRGGNGGHDERIMQYEMADMRPTDVNTKKKPRTKTMQISATGKLMEAPKPALSADARQKTMVGTIASQGHRTLTLKRGRFAQTLVVIIKYGSLKVGQSIDEILSKPTVETEQRAEGLERTSLHTSVQHAAKSTHPFFLGKATQGSTPGPTNVIQPDLQAPTDGANGAELKKPVAWKDIVFKPKKPTSNRDLQLDKPLWPPLVYQHVTTGAREQALPCIPRAERKQKTRVRVEQVSEDENLLESFSRHLLTQPQPDPALKLPKRLRVSAQDALNQLSLGSRSSSSFRAVAKAHTRALTDSSAFDRAEPPGPLPWTQHYAPSTWEEVLQPSCHVLHDWLGGLAVHNVKQGLDQAQLNVGARRRKKQKRRGEELDDFIVDDNEQYESSKIRNAILIVGPTGCGKTASVYAVANQLNFEVFEIHAGMRRSQKDIFDKVGDMAQNHMVQGGRAQLSRDSSVGHESELPLSQDEPAHQSISALFGGAGKRKGGTDSRPTTPQPNKEQKQSVILFEEVDQIFEDDRGFWSGVQALIQNSRRPVVLTCNTLHNIPLDDLDLHTILSYVAPSSEVVADYLTLVSVAEGHLIQPGVIQGLYESRGNDLRATMSELDFWCQMAVGSHKGGLDWFPDFDNRCESGEKKKKLRIFSENTYQEGLNLLPAPCDDLEDDMRFVEACAGITTDELLEDSWNKAGAETMPHFLQRADNAEFFSDYDLLSTELKPVMWASLRRASLLGSVNPDRSHLTRLMVAQQNSINNDTALSFACLEPLSSEKPIFPPSQGRLAPSLDSPRSLLATDIAPYVRSIAAFDQRLEQQREELFSSQGKKARSTRAARAAAEGGDKASTRSERWFLPDLDLHAVLKTGNNWPQWLDTGDTREALTDTI